MGYEPSSVGKPASAHAFRPPSITLHLLVAERGQRLRREQRARARRLRAVDEQVLVGTARRAPRRRTGESVGGAKLEHAARHVPRAGDPALAELARLADVEHERAFVDQPACASSRRQLARRSPRLADQLLQTYRHGGIVTSFSRDVPPARARCGCARRPRHSRPARQERGSGRARRPPGSSSPRRLRRRTSCCSASRRPAARRGNRRRGGRPCRR